MSLFFHVPVFSCACFRSAPAGGAPRARARYKGGDQNVSAGTSPLRRSPLACSETSKRGSAIGAVKIKNKKGSAIGAVLVEATGGTEGSNDLDATDDLVRKKTKNKKRPGEKPNIIIKH